MSRIRESLTEIEPTRRKWFINATAHALHRATVCAGPQLAELVRRIVRTLMDEETPGWVADARNAYSLLAFWTGEHLRDMRREYARIVETDRLVSRIRREKDEARRGFTKFLKAAGVGSLREYVAVITKQTNPI